METPPNPFDDPEFAEQMRQAGIVHKPGMAAEMLAEMAPFLAAEGIDLQDPNSIHDLDELNAALARATQQHNLRTMTPVHRDRDLALTVLVEFTETLESKNTRRAETVLNSIEPESSEHRPAASHVIGAGLGLLDNWYTNPELAHVLEDVEIPKWRGPARSTARQLLTLARRGEAYDSLNSLIMRHGGQFVMTSIMLAVAATILTYAARRDVPLLQASDALFAHDSGAQSPRVSPLGAGSDDEDLIDAFHEWLLADPDADPAETELEVQFFTGLIQIARTVGLDPEDPEDIAPLAEVLADFSDHDSANAMLLLLDRYVHFQLEGDPTYWEDAHEELMEVFADATMDPDYAAVDEAVRAAQQLPAEERAKALAATRVVKAVGPLLEWLGDSRPVTGTGNLRRKDIEPAAALLGIHARGVAKMPPPQWRDHPTLWGTEPDDVVHAQSMSQVPLLGAWWSALALADVIEITPTRALPGARAESFRTTPPSVDAAQMLAACVVSEQLLHRLENSIYDGLTVVNEAIAHLINALDPVNHEPATAHDRPKIGRFDPPRLMEFRALTHAGLLTVTDEGIVIPAPLRAAVGMGVMMAMTFLDSLVPDETEAF